MPARAGFVVRLSGVSMTVVRVMAGGQRGGDMSCERLAVLGATLAEQVFDLGHKKGSHALLLSSGTLPFASYRHESIAAAFAGNQARGLLRNDVLLV